MIRYSSESFLNMSYIYALYILLISCIATIKISGQQLEFIRHLDIEDGLPSEHILDVLFDNEQVLWIATAYGLCRYDGTEITTFNYNPLDSFSIPANNVRKLFESPDGNIWGLLTVGHLFQYHKNLDRFTIHTAEGENYYASYIIDVAWNEYGDAIIFSMDGLYYMKSGDKMYRRIVDAPDDPTGMIPFRDHWFILTKQGIYEWNDNNFSHINHLDCSIIANINAHYCAGIIKDSVFIFEYVNRKDHLFPHGIQRVRNSRVFTFLSEILTFP